MGLNDTSSANRVHIAFFGKRNAGKSSLVNSITNQEISVVSNILGTTTDPVYKAMELLPIGPVMIIDTPGFDDEGELGELRIKKTKQVLNKTDIAVLVIDSQIGKSDCDMELISLFTKKNINYIVVYNKSDLKKHTAENEISVSTLTGEGIEALKEKIAKSVPCNCQDTGIVGDLINPHDFVLLVTPIDKAAPKGRLILPQQQTIRDILDSDAIAIVTKENEISDTLAGLNKKPSLAICDSQVFKLADEKVPYDIPLTSFSILFARYKGNLKSAVLGAKAIETLKNGDTILISEGCTHHRQCNDIGTVKLPAMIKKHTGLNLNFEFTSGTQWCEDFSKYSMIVHCGGCMLTEREIKYRIKTAQDNNIPITNYGILMAYINGILKRSISIFNDISNILD